MRDFRDEKLLYDIYFYSNSHDHLNYYVQMVSATVNYTILQVSVLLIKLLEIVKNIY